MNSMVQCWVGVRVEGAVRVWVCFSTDHDEIVIMGQGGFSKEEAKSAIA